MKKFISKHLLVTIAVIVLLIATLIFIFFVWKPISSADSDPNASSGISFSANDKHATFQNPLMIDSGTKVKLSWRSWGTDKCEPAGTDNLDSGWSQAGSGGNVYPHILPTSGSFTTQPLTKNSGFVIKCRMTPAVAKQKGQRYPFGAFTDAVVVKIKVPAVVLKVNGISSEDQSGTQVPKNSKVTISWEVKNAPANAYDVCLGRIESNDTRVMPPKTIWSGSFGISGSQSGVGPIDQPYTFMMACAKTNKDGTLNLNASINAGMLVFPK